MSQPVKLSDDLVLEARTVGAVARRSIAGQVEFWARLGKPIEPLPRGDRALALQRSRTARSLAESIQSVDTEAGRGHDVRSMGSGAAVRLVSPSVPKLFRSGRRTVVFPGIIRLDAWSLPHGTTALSPTQQSPNDRRRCTVCHRHDSRGACGGFHRPATNHGGHRRPHSSTGTPSPSGGIAAHRSPADSLVEKPASLRLATR